MTALINTSFAPSLLYSKNQSDDQEISKIINSLSRIFKQVEATPLKSDDRTEKLNHETPLTVSALEKIKIDRVKDPQRLENKLPPIANERVQEPRKNEVKTAKRPLANFASVTNIGRKIKPSAEAKASAKQMLSSMTSVAKAEKKSDMLAVKDVKRLVSHPRTNFGSATNIESNRLVNSSKKAATRSASVAFVTSLVKNLKMHLSVEGLSSVRNNKLSSGQAVAFLISNPAQKQAVDTNHIIHNWLIPLDSKGESITKTVRLEDYTDMLKNDEGYTPGEWSVQPIIVSSPFRKSEGDSASVTGDNHLISFTVPKHGNHSEQALTWTFNAETKTDSKSAFKPAIFQIF